MREKARARVTGIPEQCLTVHGPVATIGQQNQAGSAGDFHRSQECQEGRVHISEAYLHAPPPM